MMRAEAFFFFSVAMTSLPTPKIRCYVPGISITALSGILQLAAALIRKILAVVLALTAGRTTLDTTLHYITLH